MLSLLTFQAVHCIDCLLFSLQRKLLAIYLHHDQSIFANVFCSQVLCAESLVSYLSANFITWAWDLTHASNREKYVLSWIRSLSVLCRPLITVVVHTFSVQTIKHGRLHLIRHRTARLMGCIGTLTLVCSSINPIV